MRTASPWSPPSGNFARPHGSLRIAYVTETYLPDVNGVASTAASMVTGLRRRGHSVQLVRPKPSAPGSTESQEGVDEVHLRSLPVPFYPGLCMGAPCRRALEALWTQRRPDVVHIATEGPLGWAALGAAHALALPVTSDFRTNFHANSRHYGIGWLRAPIMAYLRWFHNRTLRTTVPTEALYRDLEGAGFRNLAVIARGVDTVRFDPRHRSDALRARWGAAPDDTVVLSVGRLAPEKNLDTLIDAFEAIRACVQRARLVIVGDGQLRAHLQARCPDAVMAGQRVGEDLATHYASADLFLFPSLTETFGNVTAEAMASGLPVVAFDYAAAARLIRSGESGLLVDYDEPDAFIDTAVALACDRARSQALGRRARAIAGTLCWDDVVERFESILADVTQRAGPLTANTVSDGRGTA